MGGCIACCCGPDPWEQRERTPRARHSTLNQSSNRSFDSPGYRNDRHKASGMVACELCGVVVDPALLDGHKEVCRTNHLRTLLARNAALMTDANLRPSSSNTRLHDDAVNAAEKELCVVCMDRPRCYAFLPCGHISCCEECTKSLDQCPLCRQPREGLCFVSASVTAQYECKHCRQFIAPTLFEGHREVCGLRQRQKQREAEEAAAAAAAAAAAVAQAEEEKCAADGTTGDSDEGAAHDMGGVPGGEKDLLLNASNSPFTASPPPPLLAKEAGRSSSPARSHAHTCLECGQRFNQLLVCVPCGHRVLCYACAKRRTTCPVCVTEIRDTVVAFD